MQDYTAILARLGANPTAAGFVYLRAALFACQENLSLSRELEQSLYPQLALHFHTTPTAIAHGIRATMRQIWREGDAAYLEQIAGFPPEELPSVGRFLCWMVFYRRFVLEQQIGEQVWLHTSDCKPQSI